MLCLWSNAREKEINDNLKLFEICYDYYSLLMNGEIAELNGEFGPEKLTNHLVLYGIKRLKEILKQKS